MMFVVIPIKKTWKQKIKQAGYTLLRNTNYNVILYTIFADTYSDSLNTGAKRRVPEHEANLAERPTLHITPQIRICRLLLTQIRIYRVFVVVELACPWSIYP